MSSQNEWRWRTPDEELPPFGEQVLCLFRDRRVLIGRYIEKRPTGPTWEYPETRNVNVAPWGWMPLPPNPPA